MNNSILLVISLIIISIPLQSSCAQSTICPESHEKAKKNLKEFLAKERNIEGLQKDYDSTIKLNAQNNIITLTDEKNKKECQQLYSNLTWLEKQENYSIYKVADLYFIVIYSFTEDGNFNVKEIPVINNDYKAVGSIINF